MPGPVLSYSVGKLSFLDASLNRPAFNSRQIPRRLADVFPDLLTQCPADWDNADIYIGTVSYASP